jgi:hypothetical protein
MLFRGSHHKREVYFLFPPRFQREGEKYKRNSYDIKLDLSKEDG